ncbi:hypothetical protein BV898_08634 [Hypsibius exemplaris]|uniref:Tudor-knot domain-containing protein n=1 Tax=Hypsibius exemplaris TaxID=2072580 RepID=A0A1W0WQ16_HYPEX|nr:hypothetical protein BV898_08634 [Hypsibius exemplaris]
MPPQADIFVSPLFTATPSETAIKELILASYKIGDRVWVVHRGQWYRATVVQQATAVHPLAVGLIVPAAKVHYLGFKASHDEWVMGDSMMPQNSANDAQADFDNAALRKLREEAKKASQVKVKKEKPEPVRIGDGVRVVPVKRSYKVKMAQVKTEKGTPAVTEPTGSVKKIQRSTRPRKKPKRFVSPTPPPIPAERKSRASTRPSRRPSASGAVFLPDPPTLPFHPSQPNWSSLRTAHSLTIDIPQFSFAAAPTVNAPGTSDTGLASFFPPPVSLSVASAAARARAHVHIPERTTIGLDSLRHYSTAREVICGNCHGTGKVPRHKAAPTMPTASFTTSPDYGRSFHTWIPVQSRVQWQAPEDAMAQLLQERATLDEYGRRISQK